MSQHEAAARNAAERETQGPIFTVESANRTLVYVRRIVEDIVAGYSALMELRDRRSELSTTSPTPEALDSLRADIERRAEQLNDLHEELKEVGCELKDWATGLIDFPALREDRKVWLCWKLGEGDIAHWHELDEGFSGRKPL